MNTQDTASLAAACRRLAQSDGLAGVTSSSEYFIASAASLAKRLRLPGGSYRAIQVCRDKYRCRQELAKAGVGQPSFRQAVSVKGAVDAARALGFPVVVKAISGSGGVGVLLCRSADEVALQASSVLRQRANERGLPVPRRVLIEEFIEGQHFSVETFNSEIVGKTRNYLGAQPHDVEIGHEFPAQSPRDARDAVQATVRRVLDVLLFGPAHIQLRWSRKPPHVRIIEINPRLAGGFIPELVRRATGIDLIGATIRQAAGEPHFESKRRRGHASSRFILVPRMRLCSG